MDEKTRIILIGLRWKHGTSFPTQNYLINLVKVVSVFEFGDFTPITIIDEIPEQNLSLLHYVPCTNLS